MLYAKQPPVTSPAYGAGCAVLFLAAAVILTALGFEHIGGYRPCPLCLQQRYAFYAAIPLLFASLVLVTTERPRLAAALFGLVALAFLANAGLAAYHAGVEWKYWEGPAGCAGDGGPATSAADLLKGLQAETGVRCDEPALVFAGLSMAGWNAVACLVLALGAFRASRLAAEQE